MSLGFTFEGAETAGWKRSLEETLKGCVATNAKSVANRPLPPLPKNQQPDEDGKMPISLVLFYQYVEPAWTAKEHSKALGFVMNLGRQHGVTGRGRCAAEGLNCTCTGTPEGIRAFCEGLREWNPVFKETDFKITDGLPFGKRFRALTIQKKEELVAYGLPVDKAPSLADNKTEHLEAVEYHKKMTEKDTVIIDIRNRYETEIGRFCPPPGGAEFIDPKVRNSHEFPKWLNLPETQEKLKGKQVMMYCTGGIRCERFSALLSQLKRENSDFTTQGEYMVRGGVERYIKTFPEGGYWKGKNYLFDRRMEQVPDKKSHEDLEKEVESCCCVCKKPYGLYRGGFKCHVKDCMVPVIVCTACSKAPADHMKCPLCEEGVRLRELEAPKLQAAKARREARAEKRKAQDLVNDKRAAKRLKHADKPPSKRLFVGSLPLVIDATKLKEALGGGVELIHWIPDRTSGLWYGSTFVQMESKSDAKRAVALAQAGIKMGKRNIRVNFAPPGETEDWPPAGFIQLERPPVPVNPGRPSAAPGPGSAP